MSRGVGEAGLGLDEAVALRKIIGSSSRPPDDGQVDLPFNSSL